MLPPRAISIANRHPRLRFDRRTVARAIAVLDTRFAPPAATPRRPARNPSARPSAPRSAPPGELSLVFLTDAALARLHADFLADPTITDVITFEGDPLLGTAGEICISADAALRHLAAPAQTRAASPRSRPARRRSPDSRPATPNSAALSAELTLYLVHGWLHLAGYDDLQPAKKRVMRRAEARALRLLRAAAAIPEFHLRSA